MEKQLFTYENIQKFNSTDLEIYKYILANLQKVGFMTIRELAAANYISTSSVLRFCEKVGCEGYSEFKSRLRDSLSTFSGPEPGNDIREILQYFERTYTSAFEESIEAAVDMICVANTVVFIGMGGSGTLARYGARYFSNFGKFSMSLEDPYYPILQDIGGNVLIIALSVTGESHLLIEQLKDCQSLGYTILSITNSADCTIARMSDRNIQYLMKLRRDSRDSNMTTQVPVMFLIEILAHRWAERTGRIDQSAT